MYRINDDENAHCLECGRPVYGRSDKKFCSGQCRSKYHRHLNYRKEQLFSSEMDVLLKNYSILEHMILLHSRRCPVETMEAMGFNTEFATRVVKKGKHLEYRCFDFAYSISSGFLSRLRRER